MDVDLWRGGMRSVRGRRPGRLHRRFADLPHRAATATWQRRRRVVDPPLDVRPQVRRPAAVTDHLGIGVPQLRVDAELAQVGRGHAPERTWTSTTVSTNGPTNGSTKAPGGPIQAPRLRPRVWPQKWYPCEALRVASASERK